MVIRGFKTSCPQLFYPTSFPPETPFAFLCIFETHLRPSYFTDLFHFSHSYRFCVYYHICVSRGGCCGDPGGNIGGDEGKVHLKKCYIFKILLVISSLRFPDQFASSMNIFQNTNFKISNLRLAVLIKVVLIRKSIFLFFLKHDSKTVRYLTKLFVRVRYLTIEICS